MKEIVFVLVGGICSALGGGVASCMAIWYQAKKARQIKMEERTGERQFEASEKALGLIRELRTSLAKREHGNARQFYCDNGLWFSGSWMFLPDGFVEGWKSIAAELQDLSLEEQGAKEAQDGAKKDAYIKGAVSIGASLPEMAKKAENELRKAMGLKEAE